MKSTNQCCVVNVTLLPHSNAMNLSIVNIDFYSVVVNTANWNGITKGVFIPPDSVVNTDRPEFSFLKKDSHTTNLVRIKACKLRGVVSFGLLIPYSGLEPVGTDLAELYGVTHYEPEIEIAMGGDNVKASLQLPKYDIDTLRKYKTLFTLGEPIICSEKLHGCFGRYGVSKTDGFLIGSRTNWKAESKKSPWSIALENQPEIRVFCEKNPGLFLYGEVYGAVQDFKYDLNTCRFACFDIFSTIDGRFLDAPDWLNMCTNNGITTVPIIGRQAFNFEDLEGLSNGKSLIATHCREGVVIKPIKERYDDSLGRVILKLVGSDYLTKK